MAPLWWLVMRFFGSLARTIITLPMAKHAARSQVHTF
jgi:hypothetical protein